MSLETATYVDSLVVTNPVGATDDRNTADDHLRLIKACLKRTFPGISGAVTATHTQLNRVTYGGYVPSNGTGEIVPSGWTVTNDATGVYTITHGLGLTLGTDNITFSGTSQGGLHVINAVSSSANAIQVSVRLADGAGNQNANFYFMVHTF